MWSLNSNKYFEYTKREDINLKIQGTTLGVTKDPLGKTKFPWLNLTSLDDDPSWPSPTQNKLRAAHSTLPQDNLKKENLIYYSRSPAEHSLF